VNETLDPRTAPMDLNAIVDAFIDHIAETVCARIQAAQTLRPRLLTTEQAANYIGRTPNAVRILLRKDAFPAVRNDGRVMLDIRDLDRWIDQNKTKGEK
jgi:helix-turn-helix protein